MNKALFLALSLSLSLSGFSSVALAETVDQKIDKAQDGVTQTIDKAQDQVDKTLEDADAALDKADQAVDETVEKAQDQVDKTLEGADKVLDKADQAVDETIDRIDDLNDVDKKLDKTMKKDMDKMDKAMDKTMAKPMDLNQVRMIAPDGTSMLLSKADLESIQAIVTSYHDIDASLSDALTLASSGSYGTAFQGITSMPGMFPGIDADDAEPVLRPDMSSMQDAHTMLNRINTSSTQFDNLMLASGYLSQNADGSYAIDSQRLANNVKWRIWADEGIKSLKKVDMGQQKIEFSSVGDGQLMRLGSRKADLSAASFNPIIAAKTDAMNVFTTRANIIGADRDVILTGTKQGLSGPEVDMILEQRGPGPNQTAYRVMDQLADGSKRIVTKVVSKLAGGSKLEILEERLVDPQGVGIGSGVIQLDEKVIGIKELGQMRILSQADGSMLSYLDLKSGPDVLLHEDNRGVANVALLGTEREPVWAPLTLPAFASELNRLDDWYDDVVDSQDDDN